jgi:hypothetical protein
LERMPFSSAHCSTSWIVCFMGLGVEESKIMHKVLLFTTLRENIPEWVRQIEKNAKKALSFPDRV